MFSGFRSGNRRRHNFGGQPHKPSGGKRHSMRTWVFINRKKRRHDAANVMRPGDSPPPLTTSIPSGYDIPDDASLVGRAALPTSIAAGAITTTSVKPLHPEGESDIEEAVPIVHKSLPTPEPQPKIEKNGIDHKLIEEKKLVHDPDDDPCIVKCVYFAQQCCECTIL